MVRRKKTITIINLIVGFVLAIVVIHGCHPFQSSLYGVYVSNDKSTRDSIFLNTNHSYLHKFQLGDTLKIQKGKWRYSFGKIYFYDFKSYAGDLPVESGTRITDVDVSYKGDIQIEINSDNNIYYLKTK